MLKALGIGVAVLLLSQVAWAGDSGLILWDPGLARALDRIVTEPGECPSYAVSSKSDPVCAEAHHLLRRQKGLNDLDRIVLFVDRYANARLERHIADGIDVKFRADVADLLRQEVDFKLRFELAF
jgi:hypothetical protein